MHSTTLPFGVQLWVARPAALKDEGAVVLAIQYRLAI